MIKTDNRLVSRLYEVTPTNQQRKDSSSNRKMGKEYERAVYRRGNPKVHQEEMLKVISS